MKLASKKKQSTRRASPPRDSRLAFSPFLLARSSSLSRPSERPRSNARRDGRVHERPSIVRRVSTRAARRIGRFDGNRSIAVAAPFAVAFADSFAATGRFDVFVRRPAFLRLRLRVGRRVDDHQAQHDALVDLHDGRRQRRRVRVDGDGAHGRLRVRVALDETLRLRRGVRGGLLERIEDVVVA